MRPVPTRLALPERLYYSWFHHLPAHPGKDRLLRGLHRIALRSNKRFVWQMRNGSRLVLDPREGLVYTGTVGWQCFIQRVWEPHVEGYLRAILEPGDSAIDVGANIGYFTAVMAQAVGPGGRVVSFEPVPEIRESLMTALELNEFNQVDILDYALGSREDESDMAVDPRVAGSSSLVSAPLPPSIPPSPQAYRVHVKVRTLDGLLESGEVSALNVKLLKVDAEGSELDVLQGAMRLIEAARPHIVFELNAVASKAAGWSLSDIRALLQRLGGYDLYQLTHDGPQPFKGDPSLRDGDFIDLAAAPSEKFALVTEAATEAGGGW
jgi:FkbM family methyltransferase